MLRTSDRNLVWMRMEAIVAHSKPRGVEGQWEIGQKVAGILNTAQNSTDILFQLAAWDHKRVCNFSPHFTDLDHDAFCFFLLHPHTP